MKKYAVLMMALSVLMISGCKQPNFQPEVVLSDVLPELPASLSSELRSVNSRDTSPVEVIEYLNYIYAPVRETYNPLAEQALTYINGLFTALDAEVFDSYYTMRDLNGKGIWKGTSSDHTEKYFITKQDNSYTVQIWKLTGSRWVKILHLAFTKSDSNYRGTVHARSASISTDRTEYMVDFDTADPDYGKLAEISAVNIEPDDPAAEEIPRKLWLKVWEKDSSLFIAANIHYIRINIEENSPYHEQVMALLEGEDPANSKGSYMYTAAASLAAEGTEYTGVNLALVKESVDDNTDIFTAYSVGALYAEAIAAWLRTDPLNGAGTERIVVTVNNILTAGGAAERIPDPPTNAATAEIFAALSKTKEIMDANAQTSAELDAVLFAVKLVNPGYYDADGFVGTEELEKPDWAAQVPPIPDASSIVPTAAAIAADTFSFAMPQDTDPNF